MARASLCDPRSMLDPHKKPEEKRAPLKNWANTYNTKERRAQVEEEEEEMLLPCKPEPERRRSRRLPVCEEDGIVMGYAEQNGCGQMEREGSGLILRLHGLSVSDHCVLRRELEAAMEKLGLTFEKIYAWDIFLAMMRKQSCYTLQSAELPSGFTSYTRAIVVDWLIQVHDAFHFCEETLYLAVHLLNKFMRRPKVSFSTFQLLGMVCLFIASKKEECLLPEVSELCFLMENTYSKKQLLRMERKVLMELHFDLSYCHPLHFLLLNGAIAHSSAQVLWMAQYLLELSLLEVQFVVFEPVQLASAALCLACRVLQEPASLECETAWLTARSLFICSERVVRRVMQAMARAAARVGASETRTTYLKFSTMDRLQVSMHPALHSSPLLLELL
ncbi:cyclin-P isoform X2 [Amia ocellicauda]|uniref:cyclin-P isoform X2 n=1 Tax=Amia ocellicauda TaxID=2972642 RepID=UPI003464C351